MMTLTAGIRLAAAALLPVLCAAAFYALEKKSGFARLAFGKKQAIIGTVFGVLAILSTEFGIPESPTKVSGSCKFKSFLYCL